MYTRSWGLAALTGPTVLLLLLFLTGPTPVSTAPPQPQPQTIQPQTQSGYSGPYLTTGRRYVNPTLQRFVNQAASEVHESISTLPGYTVFDNIEFTISASLDQVTLSGQATDAALASQAAAAVKGIPGITQVTDRIQVLAASNRDTRLRQLALDAVYGAPQLARYKGETNPPIHIVVDNGRVLLVGVVADARDRNLAFEKASRVQGVASARNELTVDPYAASDYPG